MMENFSREKIQKIDKQYKLETVVLFGSLVSGKIKKGASL